MMSFGTILCAIPSACWDKSESANLAIELLRRFFVDLETFERRLVKRVAFEDESARYARLCRQIEQVALSNAVFAPSGWDFRKSLRHGVFPVIRIGSEYLDLIRLLHLKGQTIKNDNEMRFGSSVFSPAQLKTHLRAFMETAKAYQYIDYTAIRHRIWFLQKRIISNKCGLVEVPDVLISPMVKDHENIKSGMDGRSLWERLMARFRTKVPEPLVSPQERRNQVIGNVVPESATNDWMQYGLKNRGEFMEIRLRTQIEDALGKGSAVNLMNQRQNMVTQIFQRFIHKKEGVQPGEAPLTYNDGRTARPFPLLCLPNMPEGWTADKEFHIGLVSMRHLPIDQYIDLNWYRNVEVPNREGLTSADEACFQYSMKQFTELLSINRKQLLRLHLYHTGYMPAVIGFYRALVTILASGQYEDYCLQVIPNLQPDEKSGFKKGNPWPE